MAKTHYGVPRESRGRRRTDNSVSSLSLLVPLHQVGKLDSWEDFRDLQGYDFIYHAIKRSVVTRAS